MQNYQKLIVWQQAPQLVIQLYKITKSFPKEEQYGLTSQLRRFIISIPANMAEGCGRNSQKDVARFFQFSLGSLHESEYYILLSKDLGYIDMEDFLQLNAQLNSIKAMRVTLLKKVIKTA